MRDKIALILQEINEKLKTSNELSNSLLVGDAGICLFNILYSLNFDNSDDDFIEDFISEKVQKIAESSFTSLNSTLCNGKSGVYFFFNYLNKIGLLEDDVKNILCSDEEYLANQALQYIKIGNYDFLHGSIGICYYLLYSNYKNEKFFRQIFNELDNIRISHNGIIPEWNFESQDFDSTKINLGLAHGLPSILKFCIESYKNNICKIQSQELAQMIVSDIMRCKNHNIDLSYFGSTYDKDINSRNSRLAWCYGDLSLAFILFQYATIFNDNEIKEFSIEVLAFSTLRKKFSETFVNDVGICHGSAGIVHIYNKIWMETKDKRFKNARDFWINDILNTWENKDDLIFKRYIGKAGKFEYSNSLLEGVTGVGLVLTSILTNDNSWDYCIMLNN